MTAGQKLLMQAPAAAGGGVPVIESSTTDTTGGTANGQTLLTEPSGLASGDLILVVWAIETANTDVSPALSTPDAYTKIAGGDNSADVHVTIYWRISDGAETWPLDVHATNNQDWAVAWCHRISGAHATTPINQTGTFVKGVGNAPVIAEVTTDVDDCLGLFVVATDGADCTPASITTGAGWAVDDTLEEPTDSGSGVGASYGTKQLTSSGATGSITLSLGATDGYIGVQIAIAPA